MKRGSAAVVPGVHIGATVEEQSNRLGIGAAACRVKKRSLEATVAGSDICASVQFLSNLFRNSPGHPLPVQQMRLAARGLGSRERFFTLAEGVFADEPEKVRAGWRHPGA
ncbi:MAG: hypothetical protein OYK82_00585 [Gammaproteobacteria bacterium]|nr:hypothetical protein [Gammaproteobacteria bacterium]